MNRSPGSGSPRTEPVCPITGERIAPGNGVRFALVRPGLADRIRQDHPAITPENFVDRAALADYRARYVEDLLRSERSELTRIEQDVVASLRNQEILSVDVEAKFDANRTMGQTLADMVASFGGSWAFIIIFFALLSAWMMMNVILGSIRAFDPYPFILLNLVLSCLAAVQAPIILMSQKRQETKDRKRSENDYRINLKAELEIHHLHEKLDHIMNRQWERLTEIQTMQIELLQDLKASRGPAR